MIFVNNVGTLTQNDMIFKKLSLEQIQYTSENLKEIEKVLRRNCDKSEGPLKDIADRLASEETKRKKYYRYELNHK